MDEKEKKEKKPTKANVTYDISGNYSENEHYIHEFMHKDYKNKGLGIFNILCDVVAMAILHFHPWVLK